MPSTMGSTQVTITLTPHKCADEFKKRMFTLTPQSPVMKIGRSSRTNNVDRAAPEFGNASFSSPVVSRNHAQLSMDQNGKLVSIQDLGSLHGTLVNGVSVRKNVAYPLQQGDRITLGNTIVQGPNSYKAREFMIEWLWHAYEYEDKYERFLFSTANNSSSPPSSATIDPEISNSSTHALPIKDDNLLPKDSGNNSTFTVPETDSEYDSDYKFSGSEESEESDEDSLSDDLREEDNQSDHDKDEDIHSIVGLKQMNPNTTSLTHLAGTTAKSPIEISGRPQPNVIDLLSEDEYQISWTKPKVAQSSVQVPDQNPEIPREQGAEIPSILSDHDDTRNLKSATVESVDSIDEDERVMQRRTPEVQTGNSAQMSFSQDAHQESDAPILGQLNHQNDDDGGLYDSDRDDEIIQAIFGKDSEPMPECDASSVNAVLGSSKVASDTEFRPKNPGVDQPSKNVTPTEQAPKISVPQRFTSPHQSGVNKVPESTHFDTPYSFGEFPAGPSTRNSTFDSIRQTEPPWRSSYGRASHCFDDQYQYQSYPSFARNNPYRLPPDFSQPVMYPEINMGSAGPDRNPYRSISGHNLLGWTEFRPAPRPISDHCSLPFVLPCSSQSSAEQATSTNDVNTSTVPPEAPNCLNLINVIPVPPHVEAPKSTGIQFPTAKKFSASAVSKPPTTNLIEDESMARQLQIKDLVPNLRQIQTMEIEAASSNKKRKADLVANETHREETFPIQTIDKMVADIDPKQSTPEQTTLKLHVSKPMQTLVSPKNIEIQMRDASTVVEVSPESPRKKARTSAATPFLVGALAGGLGVLGALIALPESFF